MLQQGYELSEFTPRLSTLGDFEARLVSVDSPDLLWIPCFRQRDLAAAVRWGKKRNVSVVFDPLISAYDKQVFERRKLSAPNVRAKRLLKWESALFQRADLVLADTWEHARFFSETLGVDSERIAVVPVGAEENVFKPNIHDSRAGSIPTVLFYGSFLNLQGPEVIIDAARKYTGPLAVWKLVGQGPLLDECRRRAEGLTNVEFIPWLPYEELPDLIHQADILLGIFGTSAKAGRVIPNKVYQSLACGKPLVTRTAPAYPDSFINNNSLGIGWVAPGDPQQLADKVAELMINRATLAEMGCQARKTYETHFSMASISASLFSALNPLLSEER